MKSSTEGTPASTESNNVMETNTSEATQETADDLPF